jgi:YidC/Oxa1 family membrane protein insertase
MPLVYANIFQPLIDAFEWVLLRFHDLGVGWGMSIVLLTITVRMLLLPLTLKQFRSMQALQQLQPEIKKLQAKYKDDKQRLNQEMMKFYQENKVNPLGSCLPLLAQLPVFLALFYMLQGDLRVDICGQSAKPCSEVANNPAIWPPGSPPGSEAFLFIPDLTDKATGWVLIVLIVLYIGSQLLSSLLMMATNDPMQRNLMLALPLIFAVFILNFPAGLIVYWITTNVWTIVQQYIVRRRAGPLRVATGAEGEEIKHSLMDRIASRGKEPSPAVVPQTRSAPPPPPPRKKKKRSGRRR